MAKLTWNENKSTDKQITAFLHIFTQGLITIPAENVILLAKPNDKKKIRMLLFWSLTDVQSNWDELWIQNFLILSLMPESYDNGRFYARDVNFVSDVKAVSRQL